jgi:hypothetical protein
MPCGRQGRHPVSSTQGLEDRLHRLFIVGGGV